MSNTISSTLLNSSFIVLLQPELYSQYNLLNRAILLNTFLKQNRKINILHYQINCICSFKFKTKVVVFFPKNFHSLSLFHFCSDLKIVALEFLKSLVSLRMLSEFIARYKLTVCLALATMTKHSREALILFSIFLLKIGDVHYLPNHRGVTCRTV